MVTNIIRELGVKNCKNIKYGHFKETKYMLQRLDLSQVRRHIEFNADE